MKNRNFAIGLALAILLTATIGVAWDIGKESFLGGASLGVKTDGAFLVSYDGVDFGTEASSTASGVLTPCTNGTGEVLEQTFTIKANGNYEYLAVTGITVDNQVEFTKCLRVQVTYGDVTLCYSPCRDQPYDWEIQAVVDSTPRELVVRYWWEEQDEACTVYNAVKQEECHIQLTLGVR